MSMSPSIPVIFFDVYFPALSEISHTCFVPSVVSAVVRKELIRFGVSSLVFNGFTYPYHVYNSMNDMKYR